MNALQIYRYNGTPIEFEMIDGQLYANATEMCQAFGKRPVKWQELESTKRYIDAVLLKSELGTSMVVTRKSGTEGARGGGSTWIREKLILKLAQWLDVDFELWCDERIAEMLKTGHASLDMPATADELILMLAQRNVDTARRVSVLEQKIERIEQIQHQAEVELLALPAPSEPMVDMTPEAQIVRQVNTFSRAKSIGQQEVWRLVYQELYYRYRISVGSYRLDKGETKLQRLKKLGHIDKVLIVATNILRVDPVN